VAFYSPHWNGYIRALSVDCNYGMDLVKHRGDWEVHKLHFHQTVQLPDSVCWDRSSSSAGSGTDGHVVEFLVVKISTHHEVQENGCARYWWRAEKEQLQQVAEESLATSFVLIDWDWDAYLQGINSRSQKPSSGRYKYALKALGEGRYVSVTSESSVRADCPNRCPAEWERLEVQLLG
jgi:hypothetical protein